MLLGVCLKKILEYLYLTLGMVLLFIRMNLFGYGLWLATSRHLAARKEGRKEGPYMHHIDAYSDKLLLSIRYNPTRDFPFK